MKKDDQSCELIIKNIEMLQQLNEEQHKNILAKVEEIQATKFSIDNKTLAFITGIITAITTAIVTILQTIY